MNNAVDPPWRGVLDTTYNYIFTSQILSVHCCKGKSIFLYSSLECSFYLELHCFTQIYNLGGNNTDVDISNLLLTARSWNNFH